MSVNYFDGSEWHYDVKLDAISPNDLKAIWITKSFELLNLEDHNKLSYFEFWDDSVNHLIINVTSMHLERDGGKGFFSESKNQTT